MNQQHYKPLNSSNGSTVTNGHWGVGGMTSSTDNYRTYTISVYKHWYLYRHKPGWFGHYSGDRYIGKLRWMSQNADGKQNKNISQRGDLDNVVVSGNNSDESAKIAHELLEARGYLARYDRGFMRREFSWYLPKHYRLEIRCAACHMTRGEHERRRNKSYLDMKWEQNMGDWAAFITARESVVCNCPHTPRQDVIADRIRTGDGLTYD